MRLPSRRAHKLPYTKPFSSLRLVLPFHTRVLLIYSLTAVSLFSHPTYPLFKIFLYFLVYWIRQSNPLPRCFVLALLFLPPFFPCWGFSSRRSFSRDGRWTYFISGSNHSSDCCYTRPTYIRHSVSCVLFSQRAYEKPLCQRGVNAWRFS